jgi:hypothetical protein
MPTVYKVLGQAAPANTSEATLYTVPSATNTVVSTIVIANLTSTAANATLSACVAGAATANANTILKTVSIAASSTATFTLGLTLGAADVLRITSGTSNALSFQAFGSEIS